MTDENKDTEKVRRPYEGRGRHGVTKEKTGVTPIPDRSGDLMKVKRLIDAAYEVWRLKNGVPKYDHWGPHDMVPEKLTGVIGRDRHAKRKAILEKERVKRVLNNLEGVLEALKEKETQACGGIIE